MHHAIKAEVADPDAARFVFARQKTMLGRKRIERGDTVYIFPSENADGAGLIARGVVAAAEGLPRDPALERQTLRVSIAVECTAKAVLPIGRAQLMPHADWESHQCHRRFPDHAQSRARTTASDNAAGSHQ